MSDSKPSDHLGKPGPDALGGRITGVAPAETLRPEAERNKPPTLDLTQRRPCVAGYGLAGRVRLVQGRMAFQCRGSPVWVLAASAASRSTRSFMGSSECPFTHVNLNSVPRQ